MSRATVIEPHLVHVPGPYATTMYVVTKLVTCLLNAGFLAKSSPFKGVRADLHYCPDSGGDTAAMNVFHDPAEVGKRCDCLLMQQTAYPE
jgi:hypothetical protein